MYNLLRSVRLSKIIGGGDGESALHHLLLLLCKSVYIVKVNRVGTWLLGVVCKQRPIQKAAFKKYS